jgi:hypothetical protein
VDTRAQSPALDALANEQSPQAGVRLTYVWYAAVIAYSVLFTVLHFVATTEWRLALPEKMATFTASEPFQQRVLVPAVVGLVSHVLPWFGINLLFAVAEVVEWTLLVLLAYWALNAFEIGRSEAVRRWLALTVMLPAAMHLIVPDLSVGSVLSSSGDVIGIGKWSATRLFRYVYDLPAAVLTFAVFLVLWHFAQRLEQRWLRIYFVLLAVAAVNRETIIWMVPAFCAVCWGLLDRRQFAKTVIAQCAILVGILGFTLWLFSGNPNSHANVLGTNYENHLWDNLWHFTNPLYAVTYFARFALGLYVPVLLFHRYLDPVLKRTLIWFGIPLIASAVYFGRLVEQRVVIEVIPLIWLAAVQAIYARGKAEQLSEL